MITFMKRVDACPITIMLIEDEHGYKFGAFCTETWRTSEQFYGEYETCVFSFGTNNQGKDMKMYKSTGDNFLFQYCDSKCLMVGGDTVKGRSAIYLGDGFYRGSSSKT